ncbi:MAG: lysophospholipid acyltransferase family protein [Planctomycetaceae bacterium]
MSAESAAQLTILLLALAGLLMIARQVTRCGSVSVWVLTLVFRTFCTMRLNQRMHGPSPLPLTGGALVVSNHRSPLDPAVLYSASLCKQHGYLPRLLNFVTAREYCDVGGLSGWIMRTAACIPVNRDGRDMASAKEALRRLQKGELVTIFPEGGIHRGDEPRQFDTGVAWLALRGNAPVIPACVRNTPYREPIMLSYLAKQPADVLFGPPVDLSHWQGARPTQDVLKEVAEHLRLIVRNLASDFPPQANQS